MDDFRHGAHLMPGANFQAMIASLVSSASEQSAQWNSADKNASITLSNSDRDAAGSGLVSVRGLLGRSTGKYYFELVGSTSAGNRWGGFGNSSALLSSYAGGSASSAGLASGGNAVNTWTKAQAGTPSVGTTDVMGFALDLTNGRAFVALNNTWQFSSDPTTDTNPWVTGITGTVYPMGTPGNGTWRINTKTAELTYSPPSGFSQWAAA